MTPAETWVALAERHDADALAEGVAPLEGYGHRRPVYRVRRSGAWIDAAWIEDEGGAPRLGLGGDTLSVREAAGLVRWAARQFGRAVLPTWADSSTPYPPANGRGLRGGS